TSPSALYTLSLHDALPISSDVGLSLGAVDPALVAGPGRDPADAHGPFGGDGGRLAEQAIAVDALGAGGERDANGGGQDQAHGSRSEEHTSELQSRGHLVCR